MTNELSNILDGVNPTINVTDDLFRAVNGAWLESTEIPADLATTGSFMDLVLTAEADVRAIIDELAGSHPTEGEAQQVAALYGSWMNTEALSVEAIAPQIEAVRAAASHEELAARAGELAAEGVDIPFGWFVEPDLVDPSRNCLFLVQSGIGLPDEAYYRLEEHASILASYEEFMPRLLSAAIPGSDAAAIAADALAVEKALASHHMDVVTSRDTDATNHPMEWTEFVAGAPGFDWEAAFAAAGATSSTFGIVNATQLDALRASADVWAHTDLDVLKNYLVWQIVRARASVLTPEVDATNFAFYGTVLRGTTEQRERWKRGVRLVENSLGEAVGKLYVERHFPPAHKEAMLQLVSDLLEAYRRSITSLDWMGEETKRRALEKVDGFTVKIGYPDVWKDYSALTVGNDLVANVAAVSRWETAREFAKLGKPVDRTEWIMPPQMVNAYYNPLWNEIVFPAAILQFPFFDPTRDAALNYGAIGAVIGHEIGHGFDDQGSKFAADGSLNNWWTDADRAAFEERTAALVAQYDAFVPEQFEGEGPHVNGALTLGENIGDLGGLSIALTAYEISLAREGLTFETAPVIDGYTAVQRFFLSWARSWREATRTESLKDQMATDPHSPAEFRANGVVRNIAAFAEAFGVTEGDGMYLAPEDRVRIW